VEGIYILSDLRSERSAARCAWAKASSELYLRYHDEEWGVPQHSDRRLFEMLILEGAQAALSWETILNKRENYRAAFDDFDPHKMARYGKRKLEALLGNAGLVRNRLKMSAAVANARAFLEVQREFGSFDAFLWSFAGGAPIQNSWRSLAEVPAKTARSPTP
jgi:DNA-3-methyladenine glycosylase I